MRTKAFIIGCTLSLSLTGAGVKHTLSAAPASPVSAKHGSMGQWKSIPEDSTPWRREPFKSAGPLTHESGPSVKQRPVEASADLALQGIMKSSRRYYAIINGRTVKPGDHIEGWTIAEISRHRVTLRREKEKQIYDIYQGRIDRGTR